MKHRITAPDPRIRREFKRMASLGLTLVAVSVLAMIYARTL